MRTWDGFTCTPPINVWISNPTSKCCHYWERLQIAWISYKTVGLTWASYDQEFLTVCKTFLFFEGSAAVTVAQMSQQDLQNRVAEELMAACATLDPENNACRERRKVSIQLQALSPPCSLQSPYCTCRTLLCVCVCTCVHAGMYISVLVTSFVSFSWKLNVPLRGLSQLVSSIVTTSPCVIHRNVRHVSITCWRGPKQHQHSTRTAKPYLDNHFLSVLPSLKVLLFRWIRSLLQLLLFVLYSFRHL